MASNLSTYSGIERSTPIASSWVKPISSGFSIGPPACSWSEPARPSQNCAILRLEFKTVGELMGPCAQRSPMDDTRLSEPPMLRLWHELQEIKPERDKRGSKNSIFPSSTFSGLVITVSGIGCTGPLRTDSALAANAKKVDNANTESRKVDISNSPENLLNIKSNLSSCSG